MWKRALIGLWLISVALLFSSALITACSTTTSPDRQVSSVSKADTVRPSACYRFDDNLTEAKATGNTAASRTDTSITFDFDHADPFGWKAGRRATTCKRENGALVVTTGIEGDHVRSSDNLKLDGSNFCALQIRARVTGTSKLTFWYRNRGEDFTELSREFIHVPEEGQWHTYEFDYGRKWNKKEVSQFMLHLPAKASMEIDWIRFVSKYSRLSGAVAGTKEHVLDHRYRQCIYVHCPGELEYSVAVPKQGRLSLGLGTMYSDSPVTFTIQVKGRDSTQVILSKVVETNERWHDAVLDLEPFSGEVVTISFKTECDESGQVAFLSNPTLYQSNGLTSGVAKPNRILMGNNGKINVLVYLIDCLRADHLDAYGYERETAPAIRALAGNGVLFARCSSQETWTKPSVRDILTGVPAQIHGVSEHGELVRDSVVTLAEILRRAGYVTGSVVQNSFAPPDGKIGRGFSYAESPYRRIPFERRKGGSAELSEATSSDVEGFLEQHRDRSFFLYVHTVEPHSPYAPPEEYSSLFVAGRQEPSDMDRYDQEIRWADANLERTVAKLKELDLYQNTLVFVVADHGEAFGEHGQFTHAGRPHHEQVHAPLIMHLPGAFPAGRIVEQNVQLMDLAPTILDALGLPVHEGFRGLSLVPLLDKGSDNSSAAFEQRLIVSRRKETISVTKGNWKLLLDQRANTSKLYDLANDYFETTDLWAENKVIADALEAALADHVRALEAAGERQSTANGDVLLIDADAVEQMRALGYVE